MPFGCVASPRSISLAVVLVASLAACGGGGGGGGTGGGTPATPTPTQTPTQTPTTTNASGTVVDDANGNPLAGIAVKLMPWAPCAATPSPATSITPENDGCPTPLPSPVATTDASGNFTLNGVANGHYILVIGADAVATVPPGYTTPPSNCGGPCPTPSPVPGTVQATVHDNVTLTGGNQTLKAPTLPSVPAAYTTPTWETNGEYRLATMNAQTEMPCLIAWQYERSQNSLAGSSVDEWVLENVRALNAYQAVAPAGTSLGTYQIASATGTSGGVACAGFIDPQFAPGFNAAATDQRAVWFGGQYTYSTAVGLAEFPIDPRSFTDQNHPNWP